MLTCPMNQGGYFHKYFCSDIVLVSHGPLLFFFFPPLATAFPIHFPEVLTPVDYCFPLVVTERLGGAGLGGILSPNVIKLLQNPFTLNLGVCDGENSQ